MILVAGGDSFVWGSELADSPNGGPIGFSSNTFPALLAKQYGFEYNCAAYPGNSNNAIARTTILACKQAENQVAVIVTWTFMPRFEFRFNNKWESINPHNCKKEFSAFSDYFFKHVGLDRVYQSYNTLQSILTLQTYLKEHNIPYMFTASDNNFCSDPNSLPEDTRTLWELVDWNQWWFFPEANEHWLTTTPRGFYQWAMENKYTIGPHGHPLEDAHKDAAELMQEKFNELVVKNN
jgi:hypothetical protein